MTTDLLLMGLAGICGTLCRYSISKLAIKFWTDAILLPTLGVNLIGAFFLGVLTATTQEKLLLIIGTGFLGAFTTYSTFSLELVQLIIQRKLALALGYWIGTIGIGIWLAWLGYSINLQ